MDPTSLLLLAAIAMLGGISQSAIGFGFGIVFLALGGLFVDAKLVSMVSVFASIVINTKLLSQLYRHLDLKALWPLLLTVVVSVPLGVMFLQHSTMADFSGFLGLLITWSVLQQFLPSLSFTGLPKWVLALPMGMVSGLLTGAFNTGGPPLVVYVQSQAMERLRQVASLQLLLLCGSLIRLEELWRKDLLAGDLMWPVLICCGACVIGSQLGLALLKRISDQMFRRAVAGFLLILAGIYLSQWLNQV